MQKVAVVHVGLWVRYFDWTWRELQEYTTEIHVVASILQNHCKIHRRSVVKPGIILLVARQRRRDSPSEIFRSSLGSSPENNSWKGRVNLGRWKCYQSRKWARVIFLKWSTHRICFDQFAAPRYCECTRWTVSVLRRFDQGHIKSLFCWFRHIINHLLTSHSVRTEEYCSRSLFTCLWTSPKRLGP